MNAPSACSAGRRDTHRGVRRGNSTPRERDRCRARGTPAPRLRDCVPDARERCRGGGRRPGDAPPRSSVARPGRRSNSRPTWPRSLPGWRSITWSARVRREQYVGDWLPEPLVEAEEAIRPSAPRWSSHSRWRSWLSSSASRRSSGPCSSCVTSSTTASTRSPISSTAPRGSVRQLAVRARRRVREERPSPRSRAASTSVWHRTFFAAVDRRPPGAGGHPDRGRGPPR